MSGFPDSFTDQADEGDVAKKWNKWDAFDTPGAGGAPSPSLARVTGLHGLGRKPPVPPPLPRSYPLMRALGWYTAATGTWFMAMGPWTRVGITWLVVLVAEVVKWVDWVYIASMLLRGAAMASTIFAVAQSRMCSDKPAQSHIQAGGASRGLARKALPVGGAALGVKPE